MDALTGRRRRAPVARSVSSGVVRLCNRLLRGAPPSRHRSRPGRCPVQAPPHLQWRPCSAGRHPWEYRISPAHSSARSRPGQPAQPQRPGGGRRAPPPSAPPPPGGQADRAPPWMSCLRGKGGVNPLPVPATLGGTAPQPAYRTQTLPGSFPRSDVPTTAQDPGDEPMRERQLAP
jgi:hypothetical protein